ncbi:hypothetical protein B0I35DRAFT_221558 [Stachybotrys elegans]|uniref:Uncharacterized protein n=1 Tax=Stachybotrys elegans TaxID=80388 RepID=A0A8K0WT05_9HYPO|nr:hypothetical protein B0I35DRAFT_221558 [Stachybotrys elegans]
MSQPRYCRLLFIIILVIFTAWMLQPVMRAGKPRRNSKQSMDSMLNVSRKKKFSFAAKLATIKVLLSLPTFRKGRKKTGSGTKQLLGGMSEMFKRLLGEVCVKKAQCKKRKRGQQSQCVCNVFLISPTQGVIKRVKKATA